MVDDVKLAPNEFICVYNSLQKCHQIIPKDYILIVAPLWQLSEVLEGVNELPGKCLITLKTQAQIPVLEALDEIVELLNARIIGKTRNEEGKLVTSPPARQLIQVADQTMLPKDTLQ
jgi:hypothetical protein